VAKIEKVMFPFGPVRVVPTAWLNALIAVDEEDESCAEERADRLRYDIRPDLLPWKPPADRECQRHRGIDVRTADSAGDVDPEGDC
jgi:hypothetical protein